MTEISLIVTLNNHIHSLTHINGVSFLLKKYMNIGKMGKIVYE